MHNTRTMSLAAASLMAMAAMGSAQSSMPAPTASGRGRSSLRNVIGPATNWPSGKVHKRRSHYPDGQCAKIPKARKHKQHVHPLRDEYGAYTMVGRVPLSDMRRKWLAGISSQRGY